MELTRGGLYLANFTFLGFSNPFLTEDKNSICHHIGSGDMYKDKDISFDFRKSIPAINLPVDFQPTQN